MRFFSRKVLRVFAALACIVTGLAIASRWWPVCGLLLLPVNFPGMFLFGDEWGSTWGVWNTRLAMILFALPGTYLTSWIACWIPIACKNRIWRLVLACVVVVTSISCYPFLWRLYQFHSLHRTIATSDEDAAVIQVLKLSHKRLFKPDWTPRGAMLAFGNFLHLPRLRAYCDCYRSPNGITFLQRASRLGEEKLVMTLLDVGASVDTYDDHGFMVLTDGMVGGNTNVIAALIAHGVNVNQTTHWGTPLQSAIAGGFSKPDVIEFLLHAGADPNLTMNSGPSCLDLAQAYNTNMIHVLVAAGAKTGAALHQSPISAQTTQ